MNIIASLLFQIVQNIYVGKVVGIGVEKLENKKEKISQKIVF